MAGRPSVVADTPRKVSTNPTSEIGRLENEVHKWTREASFAIRALQNQPAATATPTAVTTPVTSSAAPIPALPPQPAAPLDGDLVAIAALTGKGFLHRNGEGDWSLDAEVLTEDSIPDLASSFVTTALASGEILVGNNSGLAEAVEMTGDVTISVTGVTAIGAHKVTLGQMARGANAGWALLDGGAGADLSFGKPAILGTVTEGIWHGTSVSEIYGGTNQTTYVLGDVLYASAANTLSRLAGNTTATRKFLRQLGTGGGSPVSAAPVWDTITAADAGAEPALGNPGTSGWVLSSTTGGVRSWVAQSGGASGANPTASHATNAAINGSAATFMRSDAVPAISTTAVWQLARVGLGAAADATAILTVSGGVIRNIGSGGSYPATGVGAEMFYSTSAYFIGYNRGTTAYIPVVLSGSTITLSQGPTTISDATDSSSSITGGTIISGGAGIAKKLYVGTEVHSGGVLYGASTTDASSSTTGGTILSGGLGVAKKLYVGTDIHAVGVLYGDSTTDSSSSITGGTILAGGLGVAKKAYIGTDLHALGLIYAGSGPTTLTNAAGNLLLAAHEKIANNTVLGNISGGAAVPSALTGAEVRTICGATTVGSNLFTLTNPSAITFIRINADNTVTALSDSSFRTAIGAGTSSFSGAYADLSGKPTLGTAAAHDVGYFDLAGSVTRASLGLATTDTPTFAGATINGSINQTVAANNYNTIGQDSTHNFSIGWTYNATPSSGFGLIAAYGKANDLYFQAKNIYFDSGSLAFAIQLLMSGRVRVGGGSDDGVNAFQVNGTIATTGLTVTNIISGNINGNAATVTNGITTGNYNSYSPTLTGGGASGTWSINVSGSAGSVAAGNITGTTLAGGVTGSSLTSVGTLTGLTCNGDIVISKYPGNLCIGGAGYGDWGVIRAQTGYLILNSGAWATVRINGLGSGTVESDSSGNLSTSSDERLKNILGPYTTGLAALRKLTPKSYRWNAASGLNPDDFNASLTAQDLIAAGISEAVTTYRTVPVMETVPQLDANGKPVLDGHGNAKTIRQAKADAEGHDIMEKVPANYSVSNRTILAVLVNAIKELANQVDALKKT